MRRWLLRWRSITSSWKGVGVAALLHQKVSDTGSNVAVVVSGSNVSLPLLLQIVGEQ